MRRSELSYAVHKVSQGVLTTCVALLSLQSSGLRRNHLNHTKRRKYFPTHLPTPERCRANASIGICHQSIPYCHLASQFWGQRCFPFGLCWAPGNIHHPTGHLTLLARLDGLDWVRRIRYAPRRTRMLPARPLDYRMGGSGWGRNLSRGSWWQLRFSAAAMTVILPTATPGTAYSHSSVSIMSPCQRAAARC